MIEDSKKNVSRSWVRGLAVVAVLVAVTAGCAGLREIFAPSAPGLTPEWAALLGEIRVYERRIGFVDTDNFAGLSREQRDFPFCGHASRFTLPYSYEDPAIQWRDAETEEGCRAHSRDADAYFAAVEAWGEIGSPVTPAMIEGKLDRFLYLVIHEDCHEQFGLPYGIEEALCDLITYKGMTVFSEEKYGPYAREHRAIRRYADAQSTQVRATIAHYEQLAKLYARYDGREISPDELMQQRAAIFKLAEKPLAWMKGELNNVGIANHMTYSRHYPFMETVFDALGRDLARTVAFFRKVDLMSPSIADVMRRNGIASEHSVEFVRTNEAEVLETIRRALAAEPANTGKR